MFKLVRILAVALAIPALAVATPTDFNFRDVEFLNIAYTMAVMGKFNVMVDPALSGPVTFSRKGVEPIDALREVAKLLDAHITEVTDAGLPLYVLTKAKLDPVATPAAPAGEVPTDFNFKAVPVTGIAATIGALGKFDAAVAPALAKSKLTVGLKQMLPTHALFWVATLLGARLEETTSEGGRKLYMLKPRAP